MTAFTKIVNEIRNSVAQVIIIPSILNGILIFLGLYLLLSFFDLYPMYALWFALIYSAIIIFKELEIDKLKLVERYYPHLHEKLLTAADYADVDDVMVNKLHAQVTKELKNVATSAFIERREIFTKVIICVVLSILIILTGKYHITADSVKTTVQDGIAGLMGEGNLEIILVDDEGNLAKTDMSVALIHEEAGYSVAKETGSGKLTFYSITTGKWQVTATSISEQGYCFNPDPVLVTVEAGGTEELEVQVDCEGIVFGNETEGNILEGEEHLAKLGDEELEVFIKPSSSEILVGEVSEREEKQFNTLAPVNVQIDSANTYEENLPKEQQELIKNYFRKLTED
jgi:hypothetical protein